MSWACGDEKSLSFPEIVTKVSRLSPSEDFKVRTLSALSGLWSKLLYMTELRSQDGKYEHWGHAQTHGEARSREALAEMHSEIYLELLRTPLRGQARESSAGSQADWDESIGRIKTNDPRMLPSDQRGGSTRHFNSIVLAICLLDADQEAYRLPGA